MRIKVIYRYQTDRKIILILANTIAMRVPKISSQLAYHFQLHAKCSNSCNRFNESGEILRLKSSNDLGGDG